MAIVNQFMVAGDFWSGMVEPDYRDQTSDPADLRLALHCAISLFHMSDWYFILTKRRFVPLSSSAARRVLLSRFARQRLLQMGSKKLTKILRDYEVSATPANI